MTDEGSESTCGHIGAFAASRNDDRREYLAARCGRFNRRRDRHRHEARHQ
jgi:hypothetical protein